MENNNYLVESFSNSIGADIAEFTGEAIEFTLDACAGEDGLLKEIPFVGAAIKLYNICNKVYDKHNFISLSRSYDNWSSVLYKNIFFTRPTNFFDSLRSR